MVQILISTTFAGKPTQKPSRQRTKKSGTRRNSISSKVKLLERSQKTQQTMNHILSGRIISEIYPQIESAGGGGPGLTLLPNSYSS